MRTAGESEATARVRLALPHIVRMRWFAVAGAALALAAGWALSPRALPYPTLAAILALMALSNHWLARRLGASRPARVAALVLGADVAFLTALLAASGGPHNPFALLYAIPVAMAAMVGGARWAWWLAALAASGYAASFVWHRPTHLWHQPVSLPGLDSSVEIHLIGMWISILLVSAFASDFIQRIMNSLSGYQSALRDAQSRLSHTERLAALTALAAGAAHELASPLGTVAIVARELERKAHREGLGDLGEDATVIRDEVERCRETLERMARAVRVRGVPEPEARFVDDLWELLSAELGGEIGRVRLQNELPVATEPLPIPAIQLAPLLLPLVRNALDATGEDASAGSVQVCVRRAAEGVRLDVRDRGVGMPPEVLDRAFEPLFTTKTARGGAGLGLHLVQVVCEALGGRLSLTSRAGGGTEATLLFPVIEGHG